MIVLLIVVAVLVLLGLALSLQIVTQYEKGVLFRLGRVKMVKDPSLAMIVPVIDVLGKCRCGLLRCRSSPRGSSPKMLMSLA
jgi:regulator of protease activity HflC (stomatin/prohibitin superfamily)